MNYYYLKWYFKVVKDKASKFVKFNFLKIHTYMQRIFYTLAWIFCHKQLCRSWVKNPNNALHKWAEIQYIIHIFTNKACTTLTNSDFSCLFLPCFHATFQLLNVSYEAHCIWSACRFNWLLFQFAARLKQDNVHIMIYEFT